MFTDINIYTINNKTDHISEKYIFIEKKTKTKVDIFPILGRIPNSNVKVLLWILKHFCIAVLEC